MKFRARQGHLINELLIILLCGLTVGAHARSLGAVKSCNTRDRAKFDALFEPAGRPSHFTTIAKCMGRGGGSGFIKSNPSCIPGSKASLKGTIVATRPWSWTAGVIPVLHTAILLNKSEGIPIWSKGLGKALLMVISLQASGNLVNSYIDYQHGVDTPETAGDRTIVDAMVSPRRALELAAVLFVVTCLTVVPTMVSVGKELTQTFLLGVVMVFSYTAWPFRLKYRGLGDITVFLLFGPMLMQVTAMLISGKVQNWILPFGLPAALLCEAILHANNTRDIANDRDAGIKTLASMIGFKGSRLLYYSMILCAYGWSLALSFVKYRGCALTVLTLPLALRAFKDFKAEAMQDIDEQTAKIHMLFGILMNIGFLISS